MDGVKELHGKPSWTKPSQDNLGKPSWIKPPQDNLGKPSWIKPPQHNLKDNLIEQTINPREVYLYKLLQKV